MEPAAAYLFFLGGHDLEMVTIRDLLDEAAAPYHDKHLVWGAKTSEYQQEIAAALQQGLTPVLIELTDDLALDPARVLVVDHHGERAGEGRPTSLHQVFDLLGLPPHRWTRWLELVAANDWGYIPVLAEMGATQEEIRRVRAADRAAQGITPEEEAAAAPAIAKAQQLAGGMVMLVDLPHARTAVVTDRLDPRLGGPSSTHLIIRSPEEVNVYGSGELIEALTHAFPGGWCGGALPTRGFWGHGAPVSDVVPCVLQFLGNAASGAQAVPDCEDDSVFTQLTAFPMLVRAFDRVEENHGAPGVDWERVEDFGIQLEQKLLALQRDLRSGRYKPQPLLRVYIDKDDGSQRPLSIPTVRDRVAQTAAALVLGPLLEPEFEDVSYAYRPGRSVDHAVQHILRLRDQGYRWVVDADIRRYFDEIPHDPLLTCLQQYVTDKRVLALVRQWLTVDVQDKNERIPLCKGVPQGSPVSPLLANLYLDRFDEAHLARGHKLVRFADDFVVLCKTRPQAEAALDLSEEVLNDLHLALHPDKTRITHFDHGFRYLGVQFLRSMAFRPKYPDEMPSHLVVPPRPALPARVSPETPPVSAEPSPVLEPPRLPEADTVMADALRAAFGQLAPEEASQMWEDLCEVAGEADLPLPSAGQEPSLRTLYVLEQGAVLAKEDERFVLRKNGTVLRKIPALKVDQIVIFGNIQLTTPAMQFCLWEDIPIFLLSSRGRYYGVVESPATEKVLLHREQFDRLADPAFVLDVSRALVRGKIHNSRTVLLRAARRRSSEAIRQAADALQGLGARIDRADTVETLRGLEGAAAAQYFAVWPMLVGPEWHFPGRKRRPPPDPINSLLSFGYTLLFYNTYALVRTQGLHPYAGVYHEMRQGHPALVSDLMEEFRALVVDATVLAMLSRNQVRPEDFRLPTVAGMPCLLTDAARRKVTRAFETVFNRAVTHPDASGSCDYRRAIALQAQRLVAAIRDPQQRYSPFVRR